MDTKQACDCPLTRDKLGLMPSHETACDRSEYLALALKMVEKSTRKLAYSSHVQVGKM